MLIGYHVSMASTTQTQLQSRIEMLSPLMVNQIAAGEVIERPASVVKELLDNAVDAQAQTIRIELEKGGIELIRVTDSGMGIVADDLPLALASHATSKVAKPEDLDRVSTMGFRGEALASIGSVARLKIRSRVSGSPSASCIECDGGAVVGVRPDSGPAGTSVTVRNLFYNTPARRKFLKTVQTEQGHCMDRIRAIAMSHPGIAFEVRCDNRPTLLLEKREDTRKRAEDILGKELASQLIDIHADQQTDDRGLLLWGLAGLPSLARATTRAQHVFLNGRPIRDRTIQHALKEAYRGLIEPSRHPTAVLMLEMVPGSFDVNVHPAKSEVRFRDQSLVHTVVLRAVREALQSTDLTTGFMPGKSGYAPAPGSAILPGAATRPDDAPDIMIRQNADRFVDYFTKQVPQQVQGKISYDALRKAMESPSPEPSPPPAALTHNAPEQADAGSLPMPVPRDPVLQVHNSFVVTQDEQGMLIIDQHALHERVMYEYLLARIQREPLESQQLLMPVVLSASAQQIQQLGRLEDILTTLGIQASAIGPEKLAIHAFPTFLLDKRIEPDEFVRELIERAERDSMEPNAEETLHEILDMMACKAAIKAGDQLGQLEIESLLNLREQVERSSNCPHGRPTSIRLTIAQLEKLFGRT